MNSNTSELSNDVEKFNELYVYTGDKNDYVLFNTVKINMNCRNCTIREFKTWMDLRNIDSFPEIVIDYGSDGDIVLLKYKKAKFLRRVDSTACTKCCCSKCIIDNNVLDEISYRDHMDN